MRDVLLHGLENTSLVSLLLRGVLGGFFVLARFRWFYDPSRDEHWFNPTRHRSLCDKLLHCGYGRSWGLAALVATLEVVGGGALLVGWFTMPVAFALLTLLVVASACTAREKVAEQNPVDAVDCVACYLWRVEGVYIAIAIALLLTGPGRYSLDWFFYSN
jgi:uncharacterized membrane protein YphA (DoxX/SURF4 family)